MKHKCGSIDELSLNIRLAILNVNPHRYYPCAVESGIIDPDKIFPEPPHADPNIVVPDSVIPWLKYKK